MNSSAEIFVKSLKERHQNFINRIDILIPILVGEDKDLKLQECENSLESVNRLEELLAVQDRPSWLSSSKNILHNYSTGHFNNHQLMKYFIDNYHTIKSHQWNFGQDKFKEFEFDEIFRKCRDEGNLIELLDQIIDIFQKILDSGEIDSIKLKESLEKMISMIQKNKHGSYFSLNGTWVIVVTFIKEYLFAQIESLPILGTLITALRKTVEDIDIEMKRINKSAKDEMQNLIHEEFTVLKNTQGSIDFLTYTKQGNFDSENNGDNIINIEA